MKILTVADIIVKELLESMGGGPAIDDIEVIFGCGDLPPEYLAALCNRYDCPLYYVLGNHDIRHDSYPPPGCMQLDRQIIKLGSTRVTGFSGSRWYNGNSNQYTEKQMARFIRQMRFGLWRSRGVDLIVTHAPPRFIGDAEDLCHRGFRTFHTLIDRYNPRYFIHGHIHALFEDDAERVTRVNSTSVINSCGYYVLEI